jgi:hypothetical protein
MSEEEYYPYDTFVKNSKVCHGCGRRSNVEYMVFCCLENAWFCKEIKGIYESCHRHI